MLAPVQWRVAKGFSCPCPSTRGMEHSVVAPDSGPIQAEGGSWDELIGHGHGHGPYPTIDSQHARL